MTLRSHHQFSRSRIALVTAMALVAQPLAPMSAQTAAPAAQTQASSQKPTLASAAKLPATTAAPWTPLQWPRAYQTPSGSRILLYQPQVSAWAGQRHLEAYSAVGVEKPGSQKPDLGSVKIEADTKVSVEERMVNFSDFRLTETCPARRVHSATLSVNQRM